FFPLPLLSLPLPPTPVLAPPLLSPPLLSLVLLLPSAPRPPHAPLSFAHDIGVLLSLVLPPFQVLTLSQKCPDADECYLGTCENGTCTTFKGTLCDEGTPPFFHSVNITTPPSSTISIFSP